jgi:hypothetical protein
LKTEIKFGLILGLGICAYTMVAHVFGFYRDNIRAGKYGDMAVILLPIAVLFLALREKRSRSGSLSIFAGVRTGLAVAFLSFPISAAFLWIYHHYINPGWLEFIIAYEREAMIRAGAGASDVGMRVDQMRQGNSDFAQLVGGVIGTMVLSLILSLIFSLILRKKRARLE